jgi:hypothetical protein
MYILSEEGSRLGLNKNQGSMTKTNHLGLEVERDKAGFIPDLLRIFGIHSKETQVVRVDKDRLGRDVGGHVKSFVFEDQGVSYPLETPVTQEFNSRTEPDFAFDAPVSPMRASTYDIYCGRDHADASLQTAFENVRYDVVTPVAVDESQEHGSGDAQSLDFGGALPAFRHD